MVEALGEEDEEGATPVHRLLDRAAQVAIENGCEGVDLTEEGEGE